jgi:hypothetical protein
MSKEGRRRKTCVGACVSVCVCFKRGGDDDALSRRTNTSTYT